MSKPVIQVENLSKAYQIGQIGTGTLTKDIERFWTTKILGKEDPFLRIGETNDRATKGDGNIVWSLKDLNFTINQGDAVGIIGKNGAGKSTLLKLLSRVTAPTTGQIKVKGRIASLLEVGTGFHQELSGRENIYLNGAILGMRKAEITRKFDEIVDFAGVERYIDTPVKRYSSGMYVRLAFAVAAHLESEILIVDEVLAVGDAEFQKKCLGKMGDISKGEGRTVLFVSHNMASVQNLCSRGIVLENGMSKYEGAVGDSINFYINSKRNTFNQLIYRNKTGNSFIKAIALDNKKNTFESGKELIIEIEIDSQQHKSLNIDLGIYNQYDEKIFNLSSSYTKKGYLNGDTKIYNCIIAKNPLIEGDYYVNAFLKLNNIGVEHVTRCIKFKILNGDYFKVGKLAEIDRSKIYVEHKWI